MPVVSKTPIKLSLFAEEYGEATRSKVNKQTSERFFWLYIINFYPLDLKNSFVMLDFSIKVLKRYHKKYIEIFPENFCYL